MRRRVFCDGAGQNVECVFDGARAGSADAVAGLVTFASASASTSGSGVDALSLLEGLRVIDDPGSTSSASSLYLFARPSPLFALPADKKGRSYLACSSPSKKSAA